VFQQISMKYGCRITMCCARYHPTEIWGSRERSARSSLPPEVGAAVTPSLHGHIHGRVGELDQQSAKRNGVIRRLSGPTPALAVSGSFSPDSYRATPCLRRQVNKRHHWAVIGIGIRYSVRQTCNRRVHPATLRNIRLCSHSSALAG
jgi:hypothetical protein